MTEALALLVAFLFGVWVGGWLVLRSLGNIRSSRE